MKDCSCPGLRSDAGGGWPVGEGGLCDEVEVGGVAGEGGEAEGAQLVEGGGALGVDPGVGEGGQGVVLVGQGGGVGTGDGDGEGLGVGAGRGGHGVLLVHGGCLVAEPGGGAFAVDQRLEGHVADLGRLAGDGGDRDPGQGGGDQ